MVFNEMYTSSRYLSVNFYGFKESVEIGSPYPYVMASNYAVLCLGLHYYTYNYCVNRDYLLTFVAKYFKRCF